MICEAVEKYAAEGLRINITELDVSMHEWNEAPGTIWDTPERAEEHAKYYGDIFAIFRKYKDYIDSVTLWGVTDGTSWLNGFPVRGRPDKPLLFTDDGTPKEAFYRIIDF
jgi:endo-1,4-beta-xylanase